MLTDSQSFLVGLFVQTLLYGIYLATYIQCFRWLIFTDEGWKPRKNINSVMTMATIVIFLTSTINLVTTLVYGLNGFFGKYRRPWSMYGTVILQDISELLGIMSIDCVLIYRCWIVYVKSWRVICVPVTFWLAFVACAALDIYYDALNFRRQTLNLEIRQLSQRIITGIYACNIATTVYTTTAIIHRILRKRNTSSPKRINHVMRILADSGVLYTTMVTFSLVGRLLISWNRQNPNWSDILICELSDGISFSTGCITFNLILIRVYQSRAESRDSSTDSRNVSGEQSLSGMQSDNPQLTASYERSSFEARGEAMGEIQEHRRSSDGMHKN